MQLLAKRFFYISLIRDLFVALGVYSLNFLLSVDYFFLQFFKLESQTLRLLLELLGHFFLLHSLPLLNLLLHLQVVNFLSDDVIVVLWVLLFFQV